MSRRLERIKAVTPAGASTTVFTVPEGQKYEVIDAIHVSDSAGAVDFLTGWTRGADVGLWDEVPIAAGHFAVAKHYGGLTHLGGDTFIVFPLAAGAPALYIVLNYVVVDPGS